MIELVNYTLWFTLFFDEGDGAGGSARLSHQQKHDGRVEESSSGAARQDFGDFEATEGCRPSERIDANHSQVGLADLWRLVVGDCQR